MQHQFLWSFTYWFIPKNFDSLRFCGSVCLPAGSFFLPAGAEAKFLVDENKIRLYFPSTSKIFAKTSKRIHFKLSERFHSVSERVFAKNIRWRASRFSERRRSKLSKINFGINIIKNASTQNKNWSSTKRLQLIFITIPFVKGWHSMDGTVWCNSVLSLSITKYTSKKTKKYTS